MTVNFLDVPQKDVRTSEGPVGLPILYHDASVLYAFFLVDGVKVEEMLQGTGLKPMLTGKRGIAGLVFFEYRNTTIGSYNEVGLALGCYLGNEPRPGVLRDFLRPSLDRKIGFHVVDLPVTTEGACAAGREIWGFPKFVTELPMHFGKGNFKGTVTDPKGKAMICTLHGKYGFGPKLPSVDMVLYSNHHAEIIKTVVTTKASMLTTSGHRLRLRVGNSKHPMAKNLRSLGLAGARPLAIQVTDCALSQLPAGQAV